MWWRWLCCRFWLRQSPPEGQRFRRLCRHLRRCFVARLSRCSLHSCLDQQSRRPEACSRCRNRSPLPRSPLEQSTQSANGREGFGPPSSSEVVKLERHLENSCPPQARICPEHMTHQLRPLGDAGSVQQVFTEVLVWTTTLSPFLAVFESSLLTSSPLTGLNATAGAAGLFGEAGSVLEGLCWAAGVLGWLAGDGCCAAREKLAKANRVVTSVVPVFMKYPPSVHNSGSACPQPGHEIPGLFAGVVPNQRFAPRLL